MTALGRRTVHRKAYSLIELVVVLFILAIVAGLTVSIVGWLRRSADKGTASNTMGSLASNIELYRTSYGEYPSQFDSLIKSGGSTLYDGGGTDTGLHTDLRSTDGKLTTTTLADDDAKSLTKIGIKTVMDHVAGSGAEGAPGNSGSASRPVATGGTVATINTASGEGPAIIASIFPAKDSGGNYIGVPAGTKLVVLGFGPNCTSIGKTIMSPPSYSGVGDPSKIYDRYLCVFAVYANGNRAQLKGVIDSKGDFQAQELAEFWSTKPE
jgi:prepilin-type N-terminal cleavage/methylation domain-containing protein